jgi:hypothetical protein
MRIPPNCGSSMAVLTNGLLWEPSAMMVHGKEYPAVRARPIRPCCIRSLPLWFYQCVRSLSFCLSLSFPFLSFPFLSFPSLFVFHFIVIFAWYPQTPIAPGIPTPLLFLDANTKHPLIAFRVRTVHGQGPFKASLPEPPTLLQTAVSRTRRHERICVACDVGGYCLSPCVASRPCHILGG